MGHRLAIPAIMLLGLAACTDASTTEFEAVSLRVAGFVEASGIT